MVKKAEGALNYEIVENPMQFEVTGETTPEVPKSEVWAPMELHISRIKEEYSFLLNDPSQHTSLHREQMSIPHSVRAMVLQKLDSLLHNMGLARGGQPSSTIEAKRSGPMMAELGSSIFRYMLPLSLREHIHKTAGNKSLVLSTDDVEIPWELLHDGQGFLCLKHALGRKVQTKALFKEAKRSQKKRLTALFIADPLVDLPDAEKEVSFIVKEVAGLGIVDIDYLKQEEATASKALEKLDSSSYDILHYAGHVEFNAERPEETVLRLHDDTITADYLFQIMDKPPRFVFMNACSSAKTAGIEYLERQGRLTGMASAFLSSGVDAYIGTLWPVHDEEASDLSINFYKRILRGESTGLALKNAKKDTFEKYGGSTSTWASFVLYGEPGLALFQPEAEEEIQQLAEIQLEEKTCELQELFKRKIEFSDQVGEVFDNVRRAFRQAKVALNNQMNLIVEAEGIPTWVGKKESLIHKGVRIRNFTLRISGDKRSAAEFLKQLAQIHIFWYAGYEKVVDPVEHFLKVNEKCEPSDWWKVPGIIETTNEIVACKPTSLGTEDEFRLLIQGAGMDGNISTEEYHNLINRAKQIGINDAEDFLRKIASDCGISIGDEKPST